MVNIEEIATSSDRLEALHFGVADFAASLRARTVVIGGLIQIIQVINGTTAYLSS